MSTYLLAMIVSDFTSVSKLTTRDRSADGTTQQPGVNVSVYAPPHLINKAEYALNQTLLILDYYEDYFGINFPLKKLGEFSNYL